MMNINGIYGNEIAKAPEKNPEITKKDTKTGAAENNSFQIITSAPKTNSVTYEEQLIKTAENTSTEETNNTTSEKTEEDKLKDNADRMSEEDYEALTKEGISIEEYNVERLDRVLARIKSQRAVDEVNLEQQKSQIQEKLEVVQNMASYGNGATKKIVEKLIAANLPVTEENIAKIANALELATAATQMSTQTKNYIIKNKLEPTIENIYKAQYSGSVSNAKDISEEAWQGLQAQIKDIINNAGLEVNKENMDSAKWLLNNKLPLTEDTLWACHDLNQIAANTKEDVVLSKTVEALAEGKAPASASLSTKSEEQINKVIEGLQHISEEAVEVTVQKKQQTNTSVQINYRDLQETQRRLDQEGMTGKTSQTNKTSQTEQNNLVDSGKTGENGVITDKNTNNNTSLGNESQSDAGTNGEASQGIDIQTITARRQLEEIRLKLTLESGKQLAKNGIHLETDDLSKIIDGLKQIEDQYYNNLLQERNAVVNPENLNTLKESLQGVENLKTMPSYILGSTLSSRSIQTATGLLEAGTECKQTLANANQAYENLMTAPRKDMGDSIKKAFQNVDAILADMNLETTNANERAVRILGYNQMNITNDNINQVKAYDEQVNYMMKNLQPAVTVELIKQGMNPLNMPIEELNQQIDAIKSQIGNSDQEKYSKYLWKLEKAQGITEEEKKSYMGIYRLLNNVEKTDGAALGSVLKANQEVTMSNLLTAVRTMRSGGIEANVDDSFGSLEKLTFSNERITDMINTAYETAATTETGNGNATAKDAESTLQAESALQAGDTKDGQTHIPSDIEEKFNYMNHLLQSIYDEISPEKIHSIGSTNTVMNMSVEKLQESLFNEADNDTLDQDYNAEKVKEFQNLAEESQNALRLLKDYNIPSTMNNIQAANDLLLKDQSFYKQWKGLLSKETTTEQSEQAVTEETLAGTEVSDLSDRLINSLKNKQSMTEEYSSISQDVKNLLNQLSENPVISSQDIATLQRIGKGMSFLQKLANRESYEIPIAVGDSVTNVNLTIIKNTVESGKVDMSINSDTLGKVTVSFQVKDKSLKGLITCDNRKGLEILQSAGEDLKAALGETGVEVKQMNYGIENKNNEIYRYKNLNSSDIIDSDTEVKEESASTDTLYSLAKALLVQIKEIELKNE